MDTTLQQRTIALQGREHYWRAIRALPGAQDEQNPACDYLTRYVSLEVAKTYDAVAHLLPGDPTVEYQDSESVRAYLLRLYKILYPFFR